MKAQSAFWYGAAALVAGIYGLTRLLPSEEGASQQTAISVCKSLYEHFYSDFRISYDGTASGETYQVGQPDITTGYYQTYSTRVGQIRKYSHVIPE